jgi:hypothetical protein
MFEAPYKEEKIIKIGKKDVLKIFSYDTEEENLDKYIL